MIDDWQADWERSRKELEKARHDVERLRRALDKAAVERRDQQHKIAATQQALQVCCLGDTTTLGAFWGYQ